MTQFELDFTLTQGRFTVAIAASPPRRGRSRCSGRRDRARRRCSRRSPVCARRSAAASPIDGRVLFDRAARDRRAAAPPARRVRAAGRAAVSAPRRARQRQVRRAAAAAAAGHGRRWPTAAGADAPDGPRAWRRCRAASASASRSPARCTRVPMCCCSTSRWQPSMCRGARRIIDALLRIRDDAARAARLRDARRRRSAGASPTTRSSSTKDGSWPPVHRRGHRAAVAALPVKAGPRRGHASMTVERFVPAALTLADRFRHRSMPAATPWARVLRHADGHEGRLVVVLQRLYLLLAQLTPGYCDPELLCQLLAVLIGERLAGEHLAGALRQIGHERHRVRLAVEKHPQVIGRSCRA